MAGIPNGAGVVNLTAEQMEAVIGQLDTASTDLASLCTALENTCEELKNVFKGSCADSYAVAIENIKENVLTPMKALLASYPTTLAFAQESMFKNDRELADGIRGKYSSLC